MDQRIPPPTQTGPRGRGTGGPAAVVGQTIVVALEGRRRGLCGGRGGILLFKLMVVFLQIHGFAVCSAED